MSVSISDLRVLGGKEESTRGTAIVLGSLEFDVNAKDVQIAYEVDEYARKYQTGRHGHSASVMGKQAATITFSVDMNGSGTAGTAPTWGKYLIACGYTEVVSASTSVTYQPNVTEDCNTMTIAVAEYFCEATPKQHTTLVSGCTGKVQFVNDNTGAPIRMEFEFKGKVEDETDETSLNTVSGADTTIPPAVLNSTVTAGGVAQKTDGFTIDSGEDVQMQIDPSESTGYLGSFVAARNPTATMSPELALVATEDNWAELIAGTEVAISIDAGASAGNIIFFTIGKAQLITLARGDRNGVVTRDKTFKINEGVSGNDEIIILLT